jgi:hypothetical protein
MPELAQGVADILSAGVGAENQFVVLSDPSKTASMLSLPNVRCVILTSVSSTDLQFLAEPVLGYFESGGSAIGFHGSSWQSKVGDLARRVFPAFGNSTGFGTKKDDLNVNEYRRDEVLAGIGEDLPEAFDLIGQFFALCRSPERELVLPQPQSGTRTVLYKDDQSGAPLVIAYEGEKGGRSICFTGLFFRSTPTAGNYFGRILVQEEFKSLIEDCFAWCSEGNTRYNEYSENHAQILEESLGEEERLRARAEERESSRRGRRRLALIISWILGGAGIGVLLYFGFVRSS